MVAVKIQLSGVVSRWDDNGVGSDQTMQPVTVSAATPDALRAQVMTILDELAQVVWVPPTDEEPT